MCSAPMFTGRASSSDGLQENTRCAHSDAVRYTRVTHSL